ncbi:7-cyano-7-deazaguanine synthase [Dissulfurispira thermophila]|uniref:7-cyano-7-deazaguanine synthase n=1 Tax=Dissulfurispira thermophila TaxID=2715679 RepID=A0A7G1GXW8_9BACT|nr:7-cyano-7-deazaguanine synthase QueC [Dissulfurispira thermophila]BCB95215.1 7-cyano-7-deazaguanine synthase [Dissulfurispira thermophila]
MHKKAVILLSGGIDSSTTAAIAKAEGYDIYALSFNYSQRHKLELEAAKIVADFLGVKKHLIIKFDLREIGGSALTSDIEVPKDRRQNLEGRDSDTLTLNTLTPKNDIPVTYVPARNTIFLSFALGWAEVLEASDIFIGANAVDYSGYPDCRPEYLKAFEEMANLATKVSVEGKIKFKIKAPLLYMTKAEIIRKGVELGFDYALTWSCYDPQPTHPFRDSPIHRFTPCGKCDSCIFRAKGFKESGIKDPLCG